MYSGVKGKAASDMHATDPDELVNTRTQKLVDVEATETSLQDVTINPEFITCLDSDVVHEGHHSDTIETLIMHIDQAIEDEKKTYFFLQWLRVGLGLHDRSRWDQRFLKIASHPDSNLRSNMYIGDLADLFCKALQMHATSGHHGLEPRVMVKLLFQGVFLPIITYYAPMYELRFTTEAIFKSLHEISGNRNMLVVSIHGKKGSEKPILLNTLFGLQISVGTKRSTPIVHAQLLPAKPLPGSKCMYDNILLLATDGLHSDDDPMTSSNIYLAIMPFNIANVTIYYIENQDIHDLVRTMFYFKSYRVHRKEKRRIIFVLSKVSENATTHQTIKKAVDKLYKFRYIFDFDEERDIWFLPDPWLGDPLMAPISPSYTEKVARLRQYITTDNAANPAYISTISGFRAWLQKSLKML